MKRLLLILLFFPLLGFSQKSSTNAGNTIPKDGRSFRGIVLLSTYDAVRQQLDSDSLITVKPQSDFEDFDEKNPNWIVAALSPLMDNIFYHFYNNKLYVISVFFNNEKTDYAELYLKLKANYGAPSNITPHQTTWEPSQNTVVVLDDLPSIKYIDKRVFDILKQKNAIKTPIETLTESEHKVEEQIKNDL